MKNELTATPALPTDFDPKTHWRKRFQQVNHERIRLLGEAHDHAAEIAALKVEIAALRKEIVNAKALVVDVYAMLPEQAIQARHELDKRAGPWFVFGVDRDKPMAQVAQA